MPTDRPASRTTLFATSVLDGLHAAAWSIVKAEDIPGGGVIVHAMCCAEGGAIRGFTITEGDGG